MMDSLQKDHIDDHDDVAKVDNRLAVGFDPKFESKWWITERISWLIMFLFVVAGLCGFLGRGPWSKHMASNNDAGITVEYEKVMRYKSPASLIVRIHPGVIHEQSFVLHINKDVVQKLGEQRVIPQPTSSTPESDGISYVFPMAAAGQESQVSFALQPESVGQAQIEIGISGKPPVLASALVLP